MMNSPTMISPYFCQKIPYRMHSSFFTGAQFNKTTMILLLDSCHVYDEELHKVRNEPYHIIDISSDGNDL